MYSMFKIRVVGGNCRAYTFSVVFALLNLITIWICISEILKANIYFSTKYQFEFVEILNGYLVFGKQVLNCGV